MPWQSQSKTVSHRFVVFGLNCVTILSIAGCHSANVDATISNRGTRPISLIQVEYPSASFGTQTLAPGSDFRYRFKVLGSGEMKVTYIDAAQAEHKSTGPSFNEGTQGTLAIVITDAGVEWTPAITAK